MTLNQNILGPQGMTGHTVGSLGVMGPKGMTGPIGVTGPQGLSGEDIYDILIGRYKSRGTELKWSMKDGTEIKIKNMEDSHVKNCINMLRRNPLTDTRRAWIDIFVDVQLRRRSLKLEKIKNKLNL